ncbi:hypothetical protein GGTG_11509 [Gaeumannomyces tritici R3-111a-1]|uniref:Uncharacterized protein n=1 Tax=Gaeumannomyces tritici (strain R3-111a-1) TaxID=644352 RepID=J3PDE1_GAET3|nr:hypothetical protein GGTG_11509 [Gaeumannomyces tritici R3-111a-1]EJT70486.1 hypothetical protein GGTG_11509 [Gaeumannomyces tritici R3-111a-1]
MIGLPSPLHSLAATSIAVTNAKFEPASNRSATPTERSVPRNPATWPDHSCGAQLEGAKTSISVNLHESQRAESPLAPLPQGRRPPAKNRPRRSTAKSGFHSNNHTRAGPSLHHTDHNPLTASNQTMVAIPNVMRDVLAMIEPRAPVPKGGGRGGSSSGSSSSGSSSSGSKTPSSSTTTSSSSSSGKGNTAVGTSTTTTTTTNKGSSAVGGATSSRPGTFIFIGGSGGGGFRTANGGYLPLWVFILILVLSLMTFLFIVAFIYCYARERKQPGKTRWGKVFWGATKVATFLWIPIAIYRCTCGRNRKKGSGGTFYRKVEEGNAAGAGAGGSSANPFSNYNNTAYGGAGGSGTAVPAYAPVPAPAPSPLGPPAYQSAGTGAAASYYAMAPPSSAYIPGDAKGGNPVPMSAPYAFK